MAAPTAPVPGVNGKFYRNTGTPESPVWDEVPNVRDIEAPLEFTDADVSSRLGAGFKQHEPALADIMLSITMLYDPADVDMQTFIAAAWNRTAIQILILDQAQGTSGSQGIKMMVKFFKCGRKEAVDGMMEQNFDVKNCYSAYPPAYVTT